MRLLRDIVQAVQPVAHADEQPHYRIERVVYDVFSLLRLVYYLEQILQHLRLCLLQVGIILCARQLLSYEFPHLCSSFLVILVLLLDTNLINSHPIVVNIGAKVCFLLLLLLCGALELLH